MTPSRLKELRAHAEAHRHFTTAMALELLDYLDKLAAGHKEIRRRHVLAANCFELYAHEVSTWAIAADIARAALDGKEPPP